MAELFTFETRDRATIRSNILRVVRNGLIGIGIEDPNVTPKSDAYITADGVASQLEVVDANAAVAHDENMPDTCVGVKLAAWAAIFGIFKQDAAGALGGIILSLSTASTTVTTGEQLTDDAGLRFEVTVGGIYANNATIPIRAIDTGIATNHSAGDVLRWATAPPFANEKSLVATGGLVNGVDAEDDEALRARLFAYLQSPPRSGNAEHTAELAEESTNSVQKAFVYPAIQGAGTFHEAVTAAPTSTTRSREISAALINGTVRPYVQGHYPERTYSIITTVDDVNADVAFGISVPDAPTASPAGPGGGWVNGTPWPRPDGITTFRCTVTVFTTTSQFTVDATTPPIVNVTRVAFLSLVEGQEPQLYTALVVALSGTSGAYVITLDRPFVGVAVGSYIWPEFEQAQSCIDALLEAFALMGPGEKSSNASALIRGFRHPTTAQGWASSLGTHLLKALNGVDDVDDSAFLHRTDGTSTLTGSGGSIVPAIPAAVTDAPKIFVPRNVAFYRYQ